MIMTPSSKHAESQPACRAENVMIVGKSWYAVPKP
jgi:hypothetical protein